MNNEDIFLKYLDNELSAKEAAQLERLLDENDDLKAVFEQVKSKRQQTIKALDMLNPTETIKVPAFFEQTAIAKKSRMSRLFMWQPFLRYAAAIAILATLGLSIWIDNREEPDQQMAAVTENIAEKMQTNEFEEFNFYISPNRCWNNRELVWTTLELENGN